MTVILIILLVLTVLLLVVGGYLFFHACLRVPDLPWLDREAILKTGYAPHADMIQRSNNWLLEHNAKDIWTQSEDGLKLHGVWVEAENPIGAALLIHGYHSTKLVDCAGAMRLLHDKGFHVLMPDQRCHGQSEGKYITFGVKEAGDMRCWLRHMEQELWQGPVVLNGISMGASTVMFMVDDGLPENVRCISVDCGYTSPGSIIGKVFRDVTHLPPYPWIWVADLFARLFAGFSLWEKDSVSALAKNSLPIFMVHGAADDFVPCEMTHQAFDRCGGDKQLLLVEGAGHGTSFLADRDGYCAAIEGLLRKAFGESYELRANKK